MSNKYEAFTTPAGEAVFPWISKADTEHDANGVYHVDLSVPAEEAQDFIAKLERIRAEFVATLPTVKQKSLALKPVYMEELTRPNIQRARRRKRRQQSVTHGKVNRPAMLSSESR